MIEKRGRAWRHILITGVPGIGKTTFMKKLAGRCAHLHPVGFYSSEIRDGGVRKGFELMRLGGGRSILSHGEFKGPRVGKYGVDVEGFERFLAAIPFHTPDAQLVIIDEIGRMECCSRKFVNLIYEILDSDNMLIATIALRGTSPIEAIKQRHDIRLFEMTLRNRDDLLTDICPWIDKRLASLESGLT